VRVEEEIGREKKEKRGWWDEECKVQKKKVRKVLKEWRKGKGGGQEYRREKRKYKELCDRKKQEENRNWEREAEEASTERQVWGLINRKRKKWNGINKKIKIEEWESYFRKILGGVGGWYGEIRGKEEQKKRKA